VLSDRFRALAALALTLLCVAGCGDEERSEKPRTETAAAEPAADLVARVGTAQISTATYEHWLVAAKKQRNGCGKRCKRETMKFLIEGQWVRQEAEAHGISVSDAEVKREFVAQKRKAFRNETAYDAFLRNSGQTEADFLYRVKLSLLTKRLQPVARRTGGGRDPLQRFVNRYVKKHRARTRCAPDYMVESLCGGTL
jgi:hypothetical protein